MELRVDTKDIELLQRTLSWSLSELRAEIAGTDSYDFRQSLHADEDRMRAILDRLEELNAGANADRVGAGGTR